MIATFESSLLDQWDQQLGGRRRRDHPRSLAALGYLVGGPVVEGLIEIEKLTIVILSDQPVRRGQCALRLAGFDGRPVPWGAKWGGPEQSRFLKDLRLQSIPGGHGLRLDAGRPDLLRLALALDREIEQHARHPHLPRGRHLRLPKLWAGFRRSDATGLVGGGPELTAYAERIHRSRGELMARIRRECLGLALYPLSWVSQHWKQAVAVLADLERFPRRQVFRVHHLPEDLVGFQDSAEFDFWHSRFPGPRSRRHRRGPALAAG
jgi:hypothetical protein